MLVQPYSHNQDNANVAWMGDWHIWILYVFSVLGARYLLDIVSFSTMPLGLGWTIVNVAHFIVTFYLFHWAKGSAFYTDRKDVAKLTLWEQIDGERVFTPTRKVLTILPILLFLFTWHQNDYRMDLPNILNWIVFLVIIVAKLPIVHRVRFFGINSE